MTSTVRFMKCMEASRRHSDEELLLGRGGPDPKQELAAMRKRFGLTEREAEVARLLLLRRSNNEIAELLYISKHTARHHVQSVLLKLGVHSRAEARQVLWTERHYYAHKRDEMRDQ
jgi:DNA-binding CsgD family transcriptional regulator